MSLEDKIRKLAASDPPMNVDMALHFDSPTLGAAFDYWTAKCAGRPWPDRKEIDPVDIPKLLPHLALIDVRREEDGELALFSRLAGLELESVFGSLRQRNIADVLAPDTAARWGAVAALSLDCGRPFRLHGLIQHAHKSYLQAELLVAPLGESAERISTLLVAAVFQPAKPAARS